MNEIKITDKYCSHKCQQDDNVLKNKLMRNSPSKKNIKNCYLNYLTCKRPCKRQVGLRQIVSLLPLIQEVDKKK